MVLRSGGHASQQFWYAQAAAQSQHPTVPTTSKACQADEGWLARPSSPKGRPAPAALGRSRKCTRNAHDNNNGHTGPPGLTLQQSSPDKTPGGMRSASCCSILGPPYGAATLASSLNPRSMLLAAGSEVIPAPSGTFTSKKARLTPLSAPGARSPEFFQTDGK